MGFFKDIRTLKAQGEAIQAAAPPVKDRMADATARMAQANQMMAGMAQGQMAASSEIMNGVDATATVTNAVQTGMVMNFNPVVQLDLLVLMPSGVPMPVTRQEPVMQIHLARCQPGARLRVKVDPANANNLWIDWVSPA